MPPLADSHGFPSSRWRLRAADESQARALGDAMGITPLGARILVARGLCDTSLAQEFFATPLGALHDPFLMRDMDRATDRIARALADGEPIAVYGDYDVDGLTATTLVLRTLKWLGADAEPYIPHRLNEGYGLSRQGIDHLHRLGTRLIVTVDNGVCSVDEVAHAARLGIDVVVTDHHQPGESLPDAAAVVDPHRADCDYPFAPLSGVGVAFKLAHGLARRLDRPADASRRFLFGLLDLVALGTIADFVPLTGENRVLAAHGLKALGRTQRPGLQALMRSVGIEGEEMRGDMVGFRIGPRLNAAGRTGTARDGLDLLMTDCPERSRQLARFLDEQNRQRRRIGDEVHREAVAQVESHPEMLEQPVLVVAGEGWHQGIVGIVAARLVSQFGRPAIVLSIEDGEARGSARSLDGLDIHAVLSQCEGLLERFGGHKSAAGLALAPERIDALREEINSCARTLIGERPLEPVVDIDTVARPEELSFRSMGDIEKLRPFGEGNPAPLLAVQHCRLTEPPRVLKNRHLKLRLKRKGRPSIVDAIWFGGAPYADAVGAARDDLDLAAEPTINEFGGRRSVELNIQQARRGGGELLA